MVVDREGSRGLNWESNGRLSSSSSKIPRVLSEKWTWELGADVGSTEEEELDNREKSEEGI